MFKTILTAATLSVLALGAHAAPAPTAFAATAAAPAPIVEEAPQFEETAYYCEWAYVYDGWGNWVYVWQCY